MDMNSANIVPAEDEPRVGEGAFWHTNMDIYHGYQPGEVVEVEHEPDKYWLASIQYCFKHLVLLKWIGNYGHEFWVDTSTTSSIISSTTSSSGAPSEPFGNPKRLYALGHHLQAQLKSQFKLAKPMKILEKPSLYDPSKDPYANILTVNDLLSCEMEEPGKDDGFSITPATISDTASLALAKCKSKINYGQEDEDELEAALQSLTGFEPDLEQQTECPIGAKREQVPSSVTATIDRLERKRQPGPKPSRLIVKDATTNNIKRDITPPEVAAEIEDEATMHRAQRRAGGQDTLVDSNHLDELSLELCKKIQNSAMTRGRYIGLDLSGLQESDVVFPAKPKLLFDVGGANHERLFVRGTLLSICHTIEDSSGQLNVFQWIAIVVKNVGGRLTLRWFICDEPKFKQGRLEMKSCLSKLVAEEVELPANGNNDSGSDYSHSDSNRMTPQNSAVSLLSAKGLTFSMHFCNPRIQSLSSASGATNSLGFKLPGDISTLLRISHDQEFIDHLEKSQLEHVFDARRINLDRDRPLINQILAAVRSRAPVFLDLIFGPSDDLKSRREVLISSPKMTKLVRATVRRELIPGVFEVHSDPLNGSDEIIKFIYPYDSSYTILPLEWSINNHDCLSVHPSRNPSPSANASEHGEDDENNEAKREHGDVGEEPAQVSWCLRALRSKVPRAGGPFRISELSEYDDGPSENDYGGDSESDKLDPAYWSQELRKRELAAPEFHCCLIQQLRDWVESRFKVMDRLEIFHPTSDHIICTGRIRKVVFPMLWIQLSSDCYTLVPFDVTDIYPVGWCESHELELVSLLPPRRRNAAEMEGNKKRPRKKAKISKATESKFTSLENTLMDENFDLVNLEDRQAGIDYILQERSSYVKIFFNHKCFTGPSLSKSKICTLPQYVGAGPMRLVIEEVVTKLISVAYVPPRVLNDLSSKSFEELLIERNLTNTTPVEFKAKYQKRVHREKVPVCLNPEDVALYCECVCEYIKCCYNLFGLNLYDGDFCPSNCRSLTKSNKFMKRATYYREKARQGEVVLPPGKNQETTGDDDRKKVVSKTKRDAAPIAVKSKTPLSAATNIDSNTCTVVVAAPPSPVDTVTPEMEIHGETTRARYNGRGSSDSTNSSNLSRSDEELGQETLHRISNWTIDDVARYMEKRQLGIFKTYMQAEGIDGQALMLLDRPAIEEHFQLETKSEITQEDVNKLCDTVDWFKTLS